MDGNGGYERQRRSHCNVTSRARRCVCVCVCVCVCFRLSCNNKGKVEVLRHLVERRANPTIKDDKVLLNIVLCVCYSISYQRQGRTLLHAAAASADLPTLNLALSLLFRCTSLSLSSLLDIDNFGNTPLHYAAAVSPSLSLSLSLLSLSLSSSPILSLPFMWISYSHIHVSLSSYSHIYLFI